VLALGHHGIWRPKPTKISVRNRLKDVVAEVVKGATIAHVRIDVGGYIVTASITNEAVDELSRCLISRGHGTLEWFAKRRCSEATSIHVLISQDLLLDRMRRQLSQDYVGTTTPGARQVASSQVD
jgi:molybdopterin-binding protein